MSKKGEYQKQYKEIEVIGKGNYGNAVLVQKIDDIDSIFISKRVLLSSLNKKELEAAFQEVRLLKSLNHPNIVRYIDSFIDDNELIIIMEYCEEGDLAHYIKYRAQTNDLLDEKVILNWFLQICLALDCIHRQKILHRDIKSSNIFLTSNGTVKLGDFGISKVLENTQAKALTSVGTPYYMSPEVCENKPYTYKSDIWALGCVLYELCTLKHAFSAENLLGLVMKIVREKADPIPSCYSAELQQLVNKLLQKDVKDRYGMMDIFTDKFVQNTMQEFIRNEGNYAVMIKIPIKKTPLHEELLRQNKEEKQEDNSKFELDATCVSVDSADADPVVAKPTTNPITKQNSNPTPTVNPTPSNNPVAKSGSNPKGNTALTKSPQKATPKITSTKATQNVKKQTKDEPKFETPYQRLQKKKLEESKKNEEKMKQPTKNAIVVRGEAKQRKNESYGGIHAKKTNVRASSPRGVAEKPNLKQQAMPQVQSQLQVQGNKIQKEPVQEPVIAQSNLLVSQLSAFEHGNEGETPKDFEKTTDMFNLSITGGVDLIESKISANSENLPNKGFDKTNGSELIKTQIDIEIDCKDLTQGKADGNVMISKNLAQAQIQFEKTGYSEQYGEDFDEYLSEGSVDHDDFRITLKANDNELKEVINLYKSQLMCTDQPLTYGGLEEIREQSVESSHGTFDDKSLLERDSSISTAETNRDEQPILDKKGRIEVMREKVKQELGETNYLKIYNYMKEQREKDVKDDVIRKYLTDNFGKDVLTQCFFIDQIIFMESF